MRTSRLFLSRVTTSCLRECRPRPAFPAICVCPILQRSYVTPRPSPRVRDAQRQAQSPSKHNIQNSDDALPPRHLLEAARLSGALKMQPDEVLQFLRQYMALGTSPSVPRLRQLCEGPESLRYFNLPDTGVNSSSVTSIAQLVMRAEGVSSKMLARSLLLSASSLSDPDATLQLVQESLTSQTTHKPELAGPYRHLEALAKGGDLRANISLADTYYLRKDPRAEKLFGRVEQIMLSTSPNGDREKSIHGGGWSKLGLWRQANKDEAGAREACRRGAELDNGPAFLLLSQLVEKGSKEHHVYLLKAGSLGVPQAAHRLGQLYNPALAALKRKNFTPAESDIYGSYKPSELSRLAVDWYTVAAEAGLPESQIELACYLSAEGKTQQALKWFEKAEEDPAYKETVAAFKKEILAPSR